jgi:predicted naringenin-chalcone synthase
MTELARSPCRRSTGAYVAGLGTALPGPPLRQHDLWTARFAEHFAADRTAERIFLGAGVATRHAAVNPVVEDASGWSTGARMRRYLVEALPLGKDAVAAALADAGLAAEDVGLFVVATCTGYATPGLDIRIAADLGMAPDLQRVLIGHMGCYAAVPGLGTVTDYVVSRRRPAVLLCCELTSLHVQPPSQPPGSPAPAGTGGCVEGLRLTAAPQPPGSPAPAGTGRRVEGLRLTAAPDDRGQVVSHALFGDAAAAVVLTPSSPDPSVGGLEVLDVAALTDPGTADHMTWDITDLGFRMGLSAEVPRVLGRHVRGHVAALLGRHAYTVEDVDGWAVHPGGPRILDTVVDRLGLPAAAVDESRAVLAGHGNCSSTTVLLVLDALRSCGRPRAGRPAIVTAFGPGLTLYTALLRG